MRKEATFVDLHKRLLRTELPVILRIPQILSNKSDMNERRMNMTNLERQVDALMRLCTAEAEPERRRAREEIMGFLGRPQTPCSKDPEFIIRQILLELGAPDHLVGHPYVIQGILLVVQDRTVINSITFGLYPQLAVQFNTTASRVERAIRHLIEVTWTRGDMDVLLRYFGNTVSAEKGKPTNGEFIARMANVVRQRLAEERVYS